jgi:hypothetical protein
MSPRFNTNCLALAIASAVLAVPAGACGPYFPNQLLVNGTQSVIWAPVASFDREIRRILPEIPLARAVPPSEKQDVYDQTIEIDLAELRTALDAANLPPGREQALYENYQRTRQALAEQHRASRAADEKGTTRPAAPEGLAVPEGLPPEFALYLRGLLGYSAGRMDEARVAWESLLKLPPAQRTRRTVWAKFMIGKSYLSDDPAKAVAAFRQVREEVRSGRNDPLGLAAASLGWEGKAELHQQHQAAAIELYLQQSSTGDPTAINSLATVCDEVFTQADPASMKQLAANPSASRVLMAFALAHGTAFHMHPTDPMFERWLSAVESTGAATFLGADRLAWAAYQAGDMKAAERWAAKAPDDSPIALWVRAKLLLRAGEVDPAAELLARTVRAFPPDEQWEGVPGTYENEEFAARFSPGKRAEAELGVLELSRGNYVESLDRLLKSGWWIDAAYVAERVLRDDELIGYVDRSWPEGTGPEIRHLLARRLIRVGRWKEALPYLPAALRPALDEYIASIRAGHDAKLPAHERAEMLWSAAHIARRNGMELLGTELAPDGHLDSGGFPGIDVVGARQKDREKLLHPTREELARAASSGPQPDRRFHYRFIAADHAWAAAQLLPDGSDELAALLCEAGSWIKDRDPHAADRFYKALVARCPQTALGRTAIAKKWFPDLKPVAANAGS